MKYRLLFFGLILIGVSCFPPNKAKNISKSLPERQTKLPIDSLCNINRFDSYDESIDESEAMIVSDKKPKFSDDSLHNINLFDFYGKPFRALFENKMLNQYYAYNPVFNRQDCISHVELHYPGYTSYLVVHFSDYDENIHCLNLKNTRIEYLLDEKILFVRFPRIFETVITNNEAEQDVFIDKIQKIDFRKYYGMPIDSLMSNLPKPRRKPNLSFLDKGEGCLKEVSFTYRMNSTGFFMVLYPDSLKFTPECPDLNVEYWNFNDFKKETLKKVVIYGLEP